MSAAEVLILLLVGVVVVGPKRLPDMMRKAGQYVAKLRRLSSDLRSQSGIDRILREEGLEKEIRELRALRESLSKHALFDSLVAAANKPPEPRKALGGTSKSGGPTATKPALPSTTETEQDKETSLAEKPASGSEPAAADAASGAAVAQGSDGSTTTSTAASLIKPAAATVSRGSTTSATVSKPINREPYRSFREREYPSYGPDHYDAFPDDIDESEEEIPEGAPAAAMPDPTGTDDMRAKESAP